MSEIAFVDSHPLSTRLGQNAFVLENCIWCDRAIDMTNSLEVAYQTCYDCLVPLPTD